MNRKYKDLVAWKKAMELVTGIYQATQQFPKEERYGLTSQLRCTAVSIEVGRILNGLLASIKN